MYADFKGRFMIVFAGIHPNRLGSYCTFILDTISTFGIKEKVVAVTVKGFVEKVLATNGQIGEDQAGTFWRKIDYGRGCQTRKWAAGMHILQSNVHDQVKLNPLRSEKEGNHNPSLIQPFRRSKMSTF